YAVAKAAAIPRANVYGVLDRLVQRAAVQRIDTDNGVRYSATPPAKLLAQLDENHQPALAATRAALSALTTSEAFAPGVNLRGSDELIARARTEIAAAEHSLLLAIQPREAAILAADLRHARERGVTITTLCMEACAQECAGCQGQIHRLDMAASHDSTWLLLVADHATALLAQHAPAISQGMVTSQPLLVQLVSAYIRQSLTLALLGDEMTGRFDGLLSQQAQQTLADLYPGEDVLAHIESLGSIASQ